MKYLKIYLYLTFLLSSLFLSCEDKDASSIQVPSSIVITPVNSILKPNQSVQLYSLVIDKNNSEINKPEVAWSSTNELVAIVNQKGLVTTKSKGSVTIIASVGTIQGMAEIVVSTTRRRVLSEMFTSST
jgi:uncharacterized protein YjdB